MWQRGDIRFIGNGGVERMIVYPPMPWMMAFGDYLLGTSMNEGSRPAVEGPDPAD